MTKPVQQFGRIFGMRLRAAIAALTMAVVLLASAVLAAQSEHGPSYRYKVLYDFCPLTNCPDGAIPWASLIQDPKGNLYSTASSGGGNPREGTVFKVTATGKETVLYTFTGGTDGGYSTAGLARDSAGNLYGTTQYGGDLSCDAPYGCGTVFKVNSSGHETVLYSFKGAPDGMQPQAGLIRDEAGNLYGTTYEGGDLNCGHQFGCGAVFRLDTTGKESVLYSFTWGADSGFPKGSLVMDAKGNLYGTTYGGGTSNPGTVFKVTKSGKETVLYTFKNGSDGNAPVGSLAMDAKGNLYGTTSGQDGGTNGTVFKLTKAGKETVLWDFQGPPDGAEPVAGVIMDAVGNLYGTTGLGGGVNCAAGDGNGCGTVFKLSKNGNETVLYTFTGGSDGGFPGAGLLRDAKGNLYGTTEGGGYAPNCDYFYGCGVVFKMTPSLKVQMQ